MNKKISEATPKKQKRSSAERKTPKIKQDEIKKGHLDITSSDSEEVPPEPNSNIDLESEEPKDIEPDKEIVTDISGDELSDLLDVMEHEEETIDEVIDLMKEDDDSDDSIEETEDIQKLLRYSDDSTTKTATIETPDVELEEEEDVVEVVEEVDNKPKSRWLITTCRYCGNMYRFRSDQTQPPTCGRPKCLSRYEEITKKKTALIS